MRECDATLFEAGLARLGRGQWVPYHGLTEWREEQVRKKRWEKGVAFNRRRAIDKDTLENEKKKKKQQEQGQKKLKDEAMHRLVSVDFLALNL